MKTRKFPLQFIFVILFLSIFQMSAKAEKPPIKYGKVDLADLEMKAYPLDTSTSSAILCDYGCFNSLQFKFVRLLRIKIFKKEGTYWGNQVFPNYNTDAIIRGITYNLENGEIVESKLKSESIFRERVTENSYRYRIAMPNVKEGSIIDIEFNFRGLPNEWKFQQEVPVRWSELIIDQSPYVEFRKTFFGFESLTENSDTRWVARNMPAFKVEPYMNSPNNYITKYEIELLRVSFAPSSSYPSGFFREFSTTWDAVNTQLRQNDRFGKAMQGCTFLNSIAKDIEKKYSDPFDRLKAAHEAVKKAVKWNDQESVFSTSGDLVNAFNKKIGNSGDINLILIQLLKKLEFTVYPVALSTRNHGFLSPVCPSLQKLNYVIAFVVIGEKQYFLDATEKFLPVGMLPERCINIQGRLIDEISSDWIDLTTSKKEKKTVFYDLQIDEGNVLKGKITKVDYDYAAFNFRKKFEKYNSKEEYMKGFESEHNGLSIINCDIANLDSIYAPVKESYEVKIKNSVTTVGNLMYINPLLYEQISSNPFKVEDRKYPVDFIYPSEKIYVFTLVLPDGAQVVEIPKTIKIKLPDGSVSAQYQVTVFDKSVQLSYKFAINKAIYSNIEYANLRALYSELVKKHSEQIVIKTL